MVLDEPKENDEIIEYKGITYLIDKGLLEKVKPINVDFDDATPGLGLSITSNISRGNSCSF
jgi:Fe-S cluster assembly iron-binding protein IscA